MKRRLILLFFALFILGIYFVSSAEIIKISKGENRLNWSSDRETTAKELIIAYPDLEVISYYENNVSHGFVNTLGGIGEDFRLISGREYEIISKEEVLIIR